MIRACRSAVFAALAALAGFALPSAGLAMCFPCGPAGGRILATGQANLVSLDRAAGRVTLIPNIVIEADREAFALVVPTPAVPELAPVAAGSDLWTELLQLTAPSVRRPLDGGLDCGTSFTPDVGRADDTRIGVTVISTRHVGDFTATILSSGSPDALWDWLAANGYALDEAFRARLAPYVERGWIFTAMKLDEDAVEMPPGGWNTDVEPVAITFAAATLEVPLPMLSVNMGPALAMTFWVVDAGRTELPGFDTVYANRISPGEAAAVASRYPELAPWLPSGAYLTRLQKRFPDPVAMSASVVLRPAATDDEVRNLAAAPSALGDLVTLAFPLLLALGRRAGRRPSRRARRRS